MCVIVSNHCLNHVGSKNSSRFERVAQHDFPLVHFAGLDLRLMTYQGFDVETLGGHNLRDVFLGECSQNRRLTSVIQAEHNNPGLTLLFLEHTELAKESH